MRPTFKFTTTSSTKTQRVYMIIVALLITAISSEDYSIAVLPLVHRTQRQNLEEYRPTTPHTPMGLNSAAPQRPHVCIVGAGISGLRCADILLSHGFEVTILEARDRIGGRICQSEELGVPVDIGPNWIHAWTDSDEPHPIYKLAADTSTPLHHWRKGQVVYDSSGKALPRELADRLSALMWDIVEDAFKYSKDRKAASDCDLINAEESLFDFVKRRTAELLEDERERELLILISEEFGAYIGEPIWKQSLKFAWMEECCLGEEIFVESSFSQALLRVAQPALNDARIHHGKCVKSVETSQARGVGEKVRVTTADGAKMSFDELVMTTPLGWLQHHLQSFSPALPPRLCSAINNISFSHTEKVFIKFPRAFWNDLSTDTPPSYFNWLSPDYAKDTNPCCWPQEMWDLSTSKPPHNYPIILFYTYGDCARHIINTIHGKSADERLKFLDDFFRPYYSRLPGYNADDDNCRPIAELATEWLKDELSGFASYCNFQIGSHEADQDVLTIREGCPERRLWFCGEHAAPFEECGTVAGAYLSGEYVGKRIAAWYQV